jgi:hypothetical protein
VKPDVARGGDVSKRLLAPWAEMEVPVDLLDNKTCQPSIKTVAMRPKLNQSAPIKLMGDGLEATVKMLSSRPSPAALIYSNCSMKTKNYGFDKFT